MNRNQPNWLSAACAAAFVLVYLLLPFYSVFTYGVTGMQLISYNALMIFPVLLAVLMCLGALLLSPVASMVISGICMVVTLIMMFTGRSVITSNALVSGGLSWLNAQVGNMNLNTLLYVSVGVGAVICIILCTIAFLIELIFYINDRPSQLNNPTWHFKKYGNSMNSGGYGPFNGRNNGGFKPF